MTSTNPGLAQVFYIDGLMLEINTLGLSAPFVSAWVANGISKTASNLSYNSLHYPMIGGAGLTVNFWMTQPYNFSSDSTFWAGDVGSPFNTYARVWTSSYGASQINFTTDVAGVSPDTIAVGVSYSAWHMVTAVLRTNPDSGEFKKYLYFDGVLKGTSSATTPDALSYPLTYWGVGHRNSASHSYNRIDEMQVLPYPMDATSIAALFASYGMGDTPFIRATGDFIHDTYATVVGQVDGVEVVGYQDGSTWRPNGCTIDFTLEEI